MAWRQLITEAAGLLRRAGIATPQVDARLLAEHVAGKSLLLAPDPSPEQAERFSSLVFRRSERIPLQHVTGVMYFRHLTLPAAPGVFICRPETEVLVDYALEEIRARDEKDLSVVDLCTGSGAIALAIAEEAGVPVTAVEKDPVAAAHARRSATDLDLPVTVCIGDALAWGEPNTVDVLTCNPPYVPAGSVPKEVMRDPQGALWGGGEDGLDFPLVIVERAADLLRPGGLALIEHAEDQGPALVERARQCDLVGETLPDLTGRPRFCRLRAAV